MRFPTYGKIKNVPNHQPVSFCIVEIFHWFDRTASDSIGQPPSPPLMLRRRGWPTLGAPRPHRPGNLVAAQFIATILGVRNSPSNFCPNHENLLWMVQYSLPSKIYSEKKKNKNHTNLCPMIFLQLHISVISTLLARSHQPMLGSA